jgi:ribosome biogenesis ATPase
LTASIKSNHKLKIKIHLMMTLTVLVEEVTFKTNMLSSSLPQIGLSFTHELSRCLTHQISSRPDSLDTGVRGRFSREIALPVPDATARTDILKLISQKMTLSPDVDLNTLGKSTPGYVGSDLYALCSEAGLEAIRRIVHESSNNLSCLLGSLCAHHRGVFQNILMTHTSIIPDSSKPSFPGNETPIPSLALLEPFKEGEEGVDDDASSSAMERVFDHSEEQMVTVDPPSEQESLALNDGKNPQAACFYCSLGSASIDSDSHRFISINMNDFAVAIKAVLPSAKREGFAVVPDVSWADVGALSEVFRIPCHMQHSPILSLSVTLPQRFVKSCSIMS